jgi:hypothetical protein
MKAGAGAFDIDDFVAKLITFMGGRKPINDQALGDDSDEDDEENDADSPLDWEKIARKALAKSKRVPVMDFMSVAPNPDFESRLKRCQAWTFID